MANTPPAPKKPGVVIAMPKKRRADETVSFETEKRPDSHAEIVVGVPAEEPDDTQKIHRTTLPDEPKTDRHDMEEVRRGPPPLPRSRKPDLGLKTRTFAKGELVADFYDSVDEVLLIKRGYFVLESLDSRGVSPLKDFQIVLGPGQILFEELLTTHGENGIASDFRVTAKEETEAYVLTMGDLAGEDREPVDPIRLRARLYAVLNATSEATAHARRQHVRHREEEDGALDALDQLRDRVRELEAENRRLGQENTRLHEINRQLVTSAVKRAVRERLINLEREVREQKEKARDQARKIHELEATSKSQMAYVESVTEEVLEYERLRDLLALESDDPARLIEELRRIFLQLYQCHSSRLQTLGVLGLGELGKLGVTANDLPEGERDLTEEEVEGGISEIPPDPGAFSVPIKHPPDGG